jgi:putative tryptophan/tyrosine transport system substrate-binding protein
MPDLPRIGFLNSASQNGMRDLKGSFLDGLATENFAEDQNVHITWKWAEGDYNGQLQQWANDLVREGVNVIAATGGLVSAQAAVRARRAQTTPILFLVGSNPDQLEFEQGTHGRPRYATGVNASATEHLPLRAQRFRQLTHATKVALLLRPNTSVYNIEHGMAPGLRLTAIDVVNKDFAAAFQSAIRQGCNGVLVTADPYFTSQRRTIVDLARHNHLPAGYAWSQYVDAGGLMSYGASLAQAYFDVGRYAGKVLSGTPVEELQIIVEPPPQLIINEQSANELGLDISIK